MAEYYKPFRKLLEKLKRLRRGSPYLNVLADLSVAALVLNTKTESAQKAIDEIIDSLPEN